MKYKAVIFDLGGTLMRKQTGAERTNVQVRMADALLISSGDFIPLWNTAFDELMRGRSYDCQTCLRHICQQLNVVVPDKQIELAARIFQESVNRVVMTPREEAFGVISSLKSAGYKIGLISNCTSEVATAWKETSLSPLFDVTILSYLAGVRKPDPNIYLLATERLGVAPEECVFVDDNEEFLEGAYKLGIKAVMLFAPGENDDDPSHGGGHWDGSIISALEDITTLVTRQGIGLEKV